jgi:autotransporter translocation and assembly factor TamB
MKQTRMNVRIRESENIWVDNNLAHIRLHSEIELIGNLAQPNIAGRVSVEEGYILYLDRKFQMEQGTIDFVDPNKLNPIVDLEAKTSVTTYERLEATQYNITLKISGELDQAKVELTSEPPLERSDIIALLTVGATRKQLTGKSGSGQDVSTSQILEQRIQTLSSKIISGYAGKTLEKLFGLEDVNIQGNLFRANKGSGPQLVASKRITNSAKLTYTTTVGHLNEQGIRLDYRLSKHFSFEGQTDQQGESSLSIKYNLKFK